MLRIITEMSPGDWALLVGLLANALAVLYGLRRVDRKFEKVVVAANGMKDALVTAAGIAGELKGRDDERRERAERDSKSDVV